MPRRPPPSSLRLATGPTPMRGQPKHTLPALPRPTFYPSTVKLSSNAHAAPEVRRRASHASLPPLEIPSEGYEPYHLSHSRSNSASSSSTSSSPSSSRTPPSGSADSGWTLKTSNGAVWGPWVHSSTVRVQVDIESLLPPPKPVAVLSVM